jgi:hypothetical protein
MTATGIDIDRPADVFADVTDPTQRQASGSSCRHAKGRLSEPLAVFQGRYWRCSSAGIFKRILDKEGASSGVFK